MYTFGSRIRYSETDETGTLSILGIINYMQDCSTFQSEDASVGMDYLEKRHRAWLLSTWQIVIHRRPRLGERIVAGTWPTSIKGIYGYRNFVINDQAGNSLVEAASVWFLYDTQAGTPVRVLPEDIDPYGAMEPALTMPSAPRKIAVPKVYQEGEPIPVIRHHIDTNHHVNNAVYVDMAREALPFSIQIEEIRADYKKAALLGDTLIPRVTRLEEDEWTVALTGPEGEACAVVWLKGKTKNQKGE